MRIVDDLLPPIPSAPRPYLSRSTAHDRAVVSMFSQSVLAVRALVKAVLGVALAASLLVGPPLLLVGMVGNPLPTVIPSWEDVSFAITNGQIDTWTWVKTLAVIGWVAWANLVASFGVEVLAVLRGGRARTVRVLGATQWFASRVVAQCALAGSLLFQSTVGVTASVGLPPLPIVATAPFSAPAVTEVDLDLGSLDPAAEQSTGLTVEVGRRDTLWGLAEAHLGDGNRWEAIRDANVGRAMSDGSVLPAGFTRLTKGWTMLIPSDPAIGAVAASGHVAAGLVEIERGDNLWRLSEDRLEAGKLDVEPAAVLDYVDEVVEFNDAAIDDRDLIYPGQVFTFPEVGEQATGQVRPQLEPQVKLGDGGDGAGLADEAALLDLEGSVGDGRNLSGPVPAHEPVDVQPRPDVGGQAPPGSEMEGAEGRSLDLDRAVDRLASVTVGAAGALLAAGALRALRRRRRYLLAHRSPGTIPRPPSPELEQIERALHRQSDDEAAQWLRAALGSLAARPIWEGEVVAQPLGATFAADHLDVEFAAPDAMAAPLPWATPDGGRHWHLPRSTAIEDLSSADSADSVPALVTVGVDRLLNLEGVGLLAVTGSGNHPMDLVRSIVHELATSSSAGTIDIRTTMAVAGAGAYDLVQVQSPAALVEELVPWLDDMRPRLDESLATNAFAHRLVVPDEPLGPVIVVTDEAGFETMSTLVPYAKERTLPFALVVLGEVSSEYAIEVAAHSATLNPWDETIEPQLLGENAAKKLGELLVAASSGGEEPLVVGVQLSASVTDLRRGPVANGASSAELAPVASGAERRRSVESPAYEVVTPDAGAAARSGARENDNDGDAADFGQGGDPATPDPGPTMTIQVLGDVIVSGADAELTSQQLSLLAYLACHGSSGREAIIEALWDGQVISRSRFPNLLAELRARIGRNHLPEARSGRYQLQGVTTDLVAFERGVGAANKQPPQEAVVTLRSIMTLIRGVPLTPPGRRFWSWIGDETHLAARVEALVADTAARLARFEQDLGSLDGAQRACEQGLLASPTDETLVVVLTEVYMMLGKPGLARRLVERWEDKISRLECGDPSDEPRKRLAS